MFKKKKKNKQKNNEPQIKYSKNLTVERKNQLIEEVDVILSKLTNKDIEYFEENAPELPVEQKKNNITIIIGIIIGILVIIVGYILLKTDKIRKGIFSVIVIIDIIGLLVLWIIYG